MQKVKITIPSEFSTFGIEEIITATIKGNLLHSIELNATVFRLLTDNKSVEEFIQKSISEYNYTPIKTIAYVHY